MFGHVQYTYRSLINAEYMSMCMFVHYTLNTVVLYLVLCINENMCIHDVYVNVNCVKNVYFFDL